MVWSQVETAWSNQVEIGKRLRAMMTSESGEDEDINGESREEEAYLRLLPEAGQVRKES
jgi:hypothetical protein